MILKKCLKCNAIVKVLNDCKCDECGISCCGNEMVLVKSNTTDAAMEKHIPEYKIVGEDIFVSVNHVMEDEHYIEWICYEVNNKEYFVYFKPGDEITCSFKYVSGAIIYAYCNKHSLWSIEVK